MMTMDVQDWLKAFGEALTQGDAGEAASLFADRAFWRDMLAFTWDIQTLEGRDAIAVMLGDRLSIVGATSWTAEVVELEASEGFLSFETAAGRGRGYVRLSEGKCVTLLTVLEELKGYEEPRGSRRALEFAASGASNWRTRLEQETEELGRTRQPYVLIIGGGQGGLALAARLRQLAVPAIVVDRHARSGDQWRSRSASLSLHDPVWYDHMPYLPFPDHWPVFTPKDKIADWLESYEKLMELNVWHSTECVGATFDEQAGTWTVRLRRNGEGVTLHPTHVVLATGHAGRPNRPDFPGMEDFAGIQRHSSEHPGGEGMEGARVVVVGSNNSAHDICADLVEHGAHVTMVQRSPTHIVRRDTVLDVGLAPLYSEQALAAGLTTDRADLINASMPLRLLPMTHQPIIAEVKRRDADFYARLEAAGFLLSFGEDDTGLGGLFLRRSAGYYIDVGASQMIVDGRIALRARATVDRIEPDAVVLSGGERLPADVIIYATGFGSMDQTVADLISPDVAQRIGKVWGYGSDTIGDPGPWEGELRNLWKPTAQPNFWIHAGNLSQSRFYSLTLALQLKARLEGLPTPVYRTGAA